MTISFNMVSLTYHSRKINSGRKTAFSRAKMLSTVNPVSYEYDLSEFAKTRAREAKSLGLPVIATQNDIDERKRRNAALRVGLPENATQQQINEVQERNRKIDWALSIVIPSILENSDLEDISYIKNYRHKISPLVKLKEPTTWGEVERVYRQNARKNWAKSLDLPESASWENIKKEEARRLAIKNGLKFQ